MDDAGITTQVSTSVAMTLNWQELPMFGIEIDKRGFIRICNHGKWSFKIEIDFANKMGVVVF